MANLDAREPAPSRETDANSTADGSNKSLSSDAAVVRVFRSLILPELARAANDAPPAQRMDISSEDIVSFSSLLVHGDFRQAVAFMDAARARGVEHDDILMGLLAGAARHLGLNWERDECGFGDVSIGVSRLHQVLQHLAMTAPFSPGQLQTRGRALLSPCPGEQHNFGIMMLDHVFHRAGWELRTIPSATDSQLSRITADSHFDMVGISLSCDEKLARLEKTITSIRRESRNQAVIVLVGGRVFLADPTLAGKIGADAAPPSAAAALVSAELLLNARQDGSDATQYVARV